MKPGTIETPEDVDEDKRYISRTEIEEMRKKVRLNAELPKLSNYWKRAYEQLEDALSRVDLMLYRVEIAEIERERQTSKRS